MAFLLNKTGGKNLVSPTYRYFSGGSGAELYESPISDSTRRQQDSEQVETVNEIPGERDRVREVDFWDGGIAVHCVSPFLSTLSGNPEEFGALLFRTFVVFFSPLSLMILINDSFSLGVLRRIVSNFSQCSGGTELGNAFFSLFFPFFWKRRIVLNECRL